MQNPFPGMNPYLEMHWRDIHPRLIIYTSDQLQPELPGDLRARVEERVLVESPDEVLRNVYPDVRIVERPSSPRGGATAATVEQTTAEPLLVRIFDVPHEEGFIEIREAGSGGRIITVIEILSMSNKYPGSGRKKYRQKQNELKRAGVHLVEIDLLRDGRRVFPFRQRQVPAKLRTPYQISIQRGNRESAEYYAAPLRQRLPIIPIPLRDTDKPVPLDLQSLIDKAYVSGAYDDIDYTEPLEPELDVEDAAWVAALLREKGFSA